MRGWNVAGFDWRGQGGSGRLLADPRVGHAPPYALLVDDLAAFLGAWQARTPPPHLLVGHSMGAHLLLRLLADRQPPVAGAALLSPMCGLDTRPLPEAVARLLVALACRLGLSDRPVWKDKGRSGHRQRNLTHSLVRYEDELWWRGQHPMLDVGPPSWGWLHESWRSIDWLRRPGMIERVGVPVLLLWSERDRLVRPSATRAVAARLARARVGVSQDAAHELLREEGVLQNWAVAELDAFLESFAA